MDFKNYAGSGKESGKEKKQNYTVDDFSKDDAENVTQVVNKYANKSDDVLMNDLVGMVTRQRRDGSLSDRDLDSFAENAGAMMNPEQKAKLMSIIKQLKNK